MLRFDIVDADQPRTPPLLTLTGDGAVTVRAAAPSGGVIRARLSAAATAALLRDIIEVERFTQIDDDALARATAPKQQSGGVVSLGMSAVADAPTTFIDIASPDCTHAVSFYGLAFASTAYPEAEVVQRLRRIELRLLGLAETVRNG